MATPGPADGSDWGTALRRLGSTLAPLAALASVVLFFALADYFRSGQNLFLSTANFRTVALQMAPLLVAALGMTVIIISGGIDLSAGSAVALSSIVMAWFLMQGYSPWVAVLACIGSGAAAGLFNGIAISSLRVVPFIVTLGTMTIYRGLAELVTQEGSIRPRTGQFPAWLDHFTRPEPDPAWLIPGLLPNVALAVWLALGLALALALLLRFTVFGRYVFALGSNEATARLCGVNVPLAKMAVYTLGGLFFGIAGAYYCLKLRAGSPTTGFGLELRIIAAVIIGGASLSGGRGTVLGTVSGAAIMQLLESGSALLGLSNPIQNILVGLIIIGAVTIDSIRQRRMIR